MAFKITECSVQGTPLKVLCPSDATWVDATLSTKTLRGGGAFTCRGGIVSS